MRALHRRSAVVLVCALLTSGVGVGAVPAHASPAAVTQVTVSEAEQGVRVVVLASAPVQYQLRDVRPNWIVVDVSPAQLAMRPGAVPVAGRAVTRVRVGQFQSGVVRIVVQMAQAEPFQVTPLPDRAGLILGIGEQEVRAESPASAPVAAAYVPPTPPQPITIPFKSSALAPPSDQPGTLRAQPLGNQPRVSPPSPAPARRLQSIVPGKALGAVRLGMRVQDVIDALGQPLGSRTLADGNILYQWFAPPNNSGVGVRATPAGVIFRAWIVNDPAYAIQDRVHVGTTEADALAALGKPAQVATDQQHGLRTLVYPGLGLWIVIQTDPRYAYYDQVFEIGVTAPSAVR